MKKKLIIISFLMFFTAVSVFSTASQAGMIFLMIYPGARAMAMGGASAALADDAYANYYNPAGLGLQDKKDVVLQHVNWLSELAPDMYYEYFGGTLPTQYGNFGAEIIYLTTGEAYATDADDPTGRWKPFDFALSISYAYPINENLAVGASGKFIYSFLAPEWVVRSYLNESTGGQAQTLALDLGVLYKLNDAVNFGASISNIGPEISYLDNPETTDPLPTALRVGAKYTVFENELNSIMLASDLTKVFAGSPDSMTWGFSPGDLFTRARILRDGGDVSADSVYVTDLEKEILDTWISIGAEYVYYNLLAVRGGYFIDYWGKRIGYTFGGGLIINNAIRIDIGVDSDIYDFDTSNYRLSVGFRF
ncbi:MAG: PorV/PorQ family protein [bacterium]